MVVGNTKEKGGKAVSQKPVKEAGKINNIRNIPEVKWWPQGALVYKVESCASPVNIFSWSDLKKKKKAINEVTTKLIFPNNNWVVPIRGTPVGTLKFLRKYHDINLKVWHSWQNIPWRYFAFSWKSSSNKVDVRRSSQEPLVMSIAHYLLITGKLKGMRKMHSERHIHVSLIANRAQASEFSHFGIFC